MNATSKKDVGTAAELISGRFSYLFNMLCCFYRAFCGWLCSKGGLTRGLYCISCILSCPAGTLGVTGVR
ncbi:MAG: hypothetical protein ACOYJD_01225 [Christensenellales bacterium]|jgi:hypothetical protein